MCDALESVSFVNVKEIAEYAFEKCNLVEADLSSVEKIGQRCFYNSQKLTSVSFGSQLKSVGESAFAFTKITSLDLPGTATDLGDNAFSNCTGLTEARLGEGVVSIPASLFAGNAKMEKVHLPASLQEVKENAFRDCTALKNVEYAGTEEQWKKVTVSETGNEPLLSLMKGEEVAVTEIVLNKDKLELTVGEKFTLEAQLKPDGAVGSIVWESSDKTIATVEDGVVTAVAEGKVSITAKVGAVSASCELTVVPNNENVSIENFHFTVNNPEVSNTAFEHNTLTIEKGVGGTYRLVAPTYALGDNVYKPQLTIEAPSEFGKDFSVTYESYSGMGTSLGKETIHSVDGKATIQSYGTMYGDCQVKNPSKLYIQVDGSEKVYEVSFSLYNELRKITITNQTDPDVLAPEVSRISDSEYTLSLTRGSTYRITISGGAPSSDCGRNIIVSDGDNEFGESFIYTPGDEKQKEYQIQITSPGYTEVISDRTYKLYVTLEDAPVEKLEFEKYVITINGTSADAVKKSSGWKIRNLSQFDELTIEAVLSIDDESVSFKWIRRPGVSQTILNETGKKVTVNTVSFNTDDYYFAGTATYHGATIELPELKATNFVIKKLPAPTIKEQPRGGTFAQGTGDPIYATVDGLGGAYVTFNCQWYQCDDINRTNAKPISGATSCKSMLTGDKKSEFTPPYDKAGTYWYYLEVYVSANGVVGEKVQTDCVELVVTSLEWPLTGEGSTESPYLITSAEDLVAIREAVRKGNAFSGSYFKFANDVTLPDGWEPIGCTKDGSDKIQKGDNLNAFSGVIDGENYTLEVPAGGLPLLGYVRGAIVKNLNIYGTQIAGYGLVNNFQGVDLSGSGIVIDNVTLKSGSQTLKSGLIGSVMSSENGFAGASAGFTATIRNCTIESGVIVGYTGTESRIGSIAGRLQGTIENCVSYATVRGKDYVGGLVGAKDNAMGSCEVTNSQFHGTVEGSYCVGGIAGAPYSGDAAPNAIRMSITGCTVDGTVRGKECVGGILGGDPKVAQAWNNYSITGNVFTGTAMGDKYVGGIIGYYESLNKFDAITNNVYFIGGDVKCGIGFVHYLDTNYSNPTLMDGTITFNTGETVANCPTVAGCKWIKDYNRTDDPLGKDADKLAKATNGSTSSVCYKLVASGNYKAEYYVGDALNLNGIKLTAYWTGGKTTEVALKDVTISGYNKNEPGTQDILLTYEGVNCVITVTVIPKSTKITVSVTIKGDSKHGTTSSPHGLARGGLTTWASESGVEADTAETVWDVLQRVAKKHGITFTADSNNSYGTVYIRAVNGLGEFDNGKNSGWMYTVNGTHPEVGVAAKYLKNGDNIVLHYTDDYDYEEGGNKYGQKPSGGTTTGGGSTGGTTTGGTTGTTTGGTSMITTADRNKAAAVDKLIEKIGTVTKDSGPAIEAARKAYNDLTPTQKRLVTKLKELTDAEKAYAKLTATAEDQQKAKDVMDKISKIGNVTKDSEQDIKDARKAYDALTDLQKLLVDNYETLTAAETKFAMLDTLGKVSDPYINTGDYMEELGTPNVGAIGGEWMVIGLARSGRTVPGVEDYYQKAVEYVQQSIDPDTGRLHKAKSTDNSRMILALTAIGKDVTNVGGYNLLAGLSDLEYVKYQGNNGPIWALLALDSGNYPVPSGGTTTRQALIDEILSVQTSDGGWAISGDRADSDMTGMALTALAPYYKKDPTVKQAIDKAIARLSEMQDDDGGFSTTYGDGKYIATSESTAQVLTALSALGIDGDTDSRFVKNGSSVVDALLRYYVKGGGFKHIMDGEIDGMGTEQAYYALTAYYRFLSGKTNLYDMTDIIDMGGDVVTVEPTVPAATEPAQAAQTNIPWWIIAVCIFGGAGWGVVIGIVLVPKLNKKKD